MDGGKPHFPRQALIDAYGNGGFRFADMSHRGSLLCLPSGIWAWHVEAAGEIDETSLQPVFAEADKLDLLVVGSGSTLWQMPETMRRRLRELRVGLDIMLTSTAVRTYNILLAERRRIAAALIAVA